MLSPSFTALTVLTFIGQFRVFDIVYVLTGPIGSPDFETDVLGTLIYRSAFGGASIASNDVRMSYAIALAVIVFIAMAIVSTVLIRVAQAPGDRRMSTAVPQGAGREAAAGRSRSPPSPVTCS